MTIPNDGKLGLWMTTAFVIGSVIGVAIFMLPVALAPLGMNAVIGWVIGGAGAFCLGVPLARLARGGAGIQAAIEETFGKTTGFVVVWAFWVSVWTGLSGVAVGAAWTISLMVPALANPWSVALSSAALIALTVPVNARGARASVAMAIVILLLRAIPLVAVVLLVALKASAHQPLQPLWTRPITLSSAATAIALAVFAFTGFENVSTPVGKIRNSERVIPQALLIALSMAALIYLLTCTSVMLLLPAPQLAHSASPFADAVGASWGEVAACVVAGGIAMSAFGCLGCGSMAAGELCYSMALRGDLPSGLAWTNSRGAPVVAQVISAGLAILLVLSNASRSTAGLYVFLILFSTVAVLILYVVAALATGVRETSPGIRALVFAGIVVAAYAFYGSGLEASLWGLGLAATALPVRLITRWRAGSNRLAAASPAAPQESSS